MAIKKTAWWSRQTKSNDKRKKTERKPWGWRDEPKSKPKQKKESFLDKQKREMKEKKTKSNNKVNSWIPDFGKDEPKSKPKQKKESFWDKQDRKMKEVKSKANKETVVEGGFKSRPIGTAVVERPRNTTRLSKDTVREARNRFFKEMRHEGIKLTSLGKKVEKDNYKKSENSTEYNNRNMKYFSGNKEQEGKYWVKAKKPSKSRRNRRDRRERRDRRGRKGGDKSEPFVNWRVIRRHKKNDNCYAFNIKRNDGSEFWKVLTSMPEGENQRDRDKKIIAAKGGKIFKDVSEVDNWCESQQGNRERRDREEPKPVVDRQGGTEVAVESKPRTKDQERRKFFEEMKHEGYELTKEGKRNEKDAYQSAQDADHYRKYVYKMIENKNMAIKVGKSSSTEMEMAAEYCSRDSNTKVGDWFARF